MLLHSIHILANLTLKETVPPQLRTARTSLEQFLFGCAITMHCSAGLSWRDRMQCDEFIQRQLAAGRGL